MHNPTNDDPREWTEDVDGQPLTFTERIRQPYTNMVISGGAIEGHPVDTMYLMIEKGEHGEHTRMWMLRPDEVAAINWCASSLLWSWHLARLSEEE